MAMRSRCRAFCLMLERGSEAAQLDCAVATPSVGADVSMTGWETFPK